MPLKDKLAQRYTIQGLKEAPLKKVWDLPIFICKTKINK